MFDIACGDCMNWLKTLPEGSIDLVLTDPPFGRTNAAWDTAPDYAALFREVWRVLNPNGAAVFSSMFPIACDLVQASRKEFRYDLVWEKTTTTGFLNANRMPLRSHELLLVFYRKLPVYHPQFSEGLPYFKRREVGKASSLYGPKVMENGTYSGRRFPKSVLTFPHDKDRPNTKVSVFHPTQKPQSLLKYLIETYTNPGDTVLDPFMGSGSTGVAALATGRNFIGYELDKTFFETARKRLGEEHDRL